MSEWLWAQVCAAVHPGHGHGHGLPLYAVALLFPLLGAALSFLCSDCSAEAVRWRDSLVKSRLSPPASITPVIWVTLYVLMGHASYVVYMTSVERRGGFGGGVGAGVGVGVGVLVAPSVMAYLVQCLLNYFYIIVLFGLQRIDLAVVVIVPLWVATGVTTGLFYEVAPAAGRAMAWVFAWVSVNVYLNVVLVMNNRVYTERELGPAAPLANYGLNCKSR